jgi:hypothetical protein
MPRRTLVVLLLVVLGNRRAALLQQGRGDDIVLVVWGRDMVPGVLGPYFRFVCEEPAVSLLELREGKRWVHAPGAKGGLVCCNIVHG